MVSEVIVFVRFGVSFNVYSDYDECLFYVSDTMTCVDLNFHSVRWVCCDIYPDVLFQKRILQVMVFGLTIFVDNVVNLSMVTLLCSLSFFVPLCRGGFLTLLRVRCLSLFFLRLFIGIFLKFYSYGFFESLKVLFCVFVKVVWSFS